jgi:hypothetical protein
LIVLNVQCAPTLVVEQTGALLDESDAQLLGGFKHGIVVLATAWGGDVVDS